FGVRNFYYADGGLMKRAWWRVRTPKKEQGVTVAIGAKHTDFEVALSSELHFPAPSLAGATFVAKSFEAGNEPSRTPSTARIPDNRNDAQRVVADSQHAVHEAGGDEPDFRFAMKRSAERQANADKSLERILTLLGGTPVKKRAAKKVQREVASVFSDE
ncbi:MAG: hypothetical protein J0I92_02525, partial [Phyllobacterium sp.]|nr:hypothetical protein [Phyllobacterium sp.]